jgi:hypothetical protein
MASVAKGQRYKCKDKIVARLCEILSRSLRVRLVRRIRAIS